MSDEGYSWSQSHKAVNFVFRTKVVLCSQTLEGESLASRD